MRPAGRATGGALIALVLTVSGCSAESTPQRHPAPPAQVSLVDMGFVQDMIAHHKQMIGFADALAANGSTVGIRRIASGIATEERTELATLNGLYEGWTGEEDESAENGGPTARPRPPEDLTHPREVRLLRRMIEVHFAGLLAARHERSVGMNPAAKLTALRIEKRIRSDLQALRRLLREVRGS